jgi:hypothetical protein
LSKKKIGKEIQQRSSSIGRCWLVVNSANNSWERMHRLMGFSMSASFFSFFFFLLPLL